MLVRKLDGNKEQRRKVKTEEMCFFREVTGQRIKVHKRNGDIGEELQKSEIYIEKLYQQIGSRAQGRHCYIQRKRGER
jgi:hypothetical protein